RRQVWNRYRRVWTNDGVVLLEVEARKGEKVVTFLCDLDKLELVKSRIWRISDRGYVVASDGTFFHREVLPGYEKVDHINGNPRDDRGVNLRDGSNGINE